MKKAETFLHVKIRPRLKVLAKRAAAKDDLTLTQWVNRVIADRLEVKS